MKDQHKCDLCPKSKKIKDTEVVASFLNYDPYKGIKVGLIGRSYEIFSEIPESKRKKFKDIFLLINMSFCLDHAKEIEKSVTGEVGDWNEGSENTINSEISTVRRRS